MGRRHSGADAPGASAGKRQASIANFVEKRAKSSGDFVQPQRDCNKGKRTIARMMAAAAAAKAGSEVEVVDLDEEEDTPTSDLPESSSTAGATSTTEVDSDAATTTQCATSLLEALREYGTETDSDSSSAEADDLPVLAPQFQELSATLGEDLARTVATIVEKNSVKRKVWTEKEKIDILLFHYRIGGLLKRTEKKLKELAKDIPNSPVLKIDRKQLGRWIKTLLEKCKHTTQEELIQYLSVQSGRTRSIWGYRGRKVNFDFEAEVLSHVCVCDWSKGKGTTDFEIVANVAHDHYIIISAGKDVQKLEKWQSNQRVASLKIDHNWSGRFLKRCGMRRKRITASRKDGKRPTVEEVNEFLRDVQELTKQHKIPPERVFSADETGVFFGQGPRFQFVPLGAEKGGMRATTDDSDEKARFTDFLFGDGRGEMAPTFKIIYCSTKKRDLSNTRVIHNLHGRPGFTEADGWYLQSWSRVLPIRHSAKSREAGRDIFEDTFYARPYLYHREHGHVITCQHRGWMDTSGLCMWIDTVLVPWLGRKQSPLWGSLMVWDGCGPHNTWAVRGLLQAYGIHVRCLPPNMTDYLQVMDLVVNGPFKSRMRKARIQALQEYMRKFQLEFWKAKATESDVPKWQPPKMTLTQGLIAAFDALNGMNDNDDFRAGMVSCFEKIGLIPFQGSVDDPESVFFNEWTGIVPGNKLKHSVVGKFVAMLQTQQRNQIALADLMDDVELIEREEDVLEECNESGEEGDSEGEEGADDDFD